MYVKALKGFQTFVDVLVKAPFSLPDSHICHS